MNPSIQGRKIHIKGIVQGVGFRPFIYSLAQRFNLTGWVRNSTAGVDIEISGIATNIQRFIEAVSVELPPLARIDAFQIDPVIAQDFPSFTILSSQSSEDEFLPISPDVSICPQCQAELFDPTNRRFRYPFINCTHCGPRFTIIQDIPYDRGNTTMACFPLCAECLAEYHNPVDRRFHAQPVACPVCGPQVELILNGQVKASGDTAIRLARQMLKRGKILAIKGLGGHHLACDAENNIAVETLRSRKKRSDKPFALMAFHLEEIQRHVIISPEEQNLLLSRQKPIVLLEKRPDSPISPLVAPNQTSLGYMLAYTPLHLLLLEPEPGFPQSLVMTSGNLSDEPIAYKDDDAFEKLRHIADAFLVHNRNIHTRVDDSVVRSEYDKPYLIRRSRGYAPDSIHLPVQGPSVLATGAELKNTFCLTRDDYAFLSHHIGDMENLETLQAFEEGIRHFERLFRVTPQVIASDLHPDFLASRYAAGRSRAQSIPLILVQHHHAHLAACLADNGWNTTEPVIGLIFDGTGLGTDGNIWGGEILVGGYSGYQRQYHLAGSPLPGGDASVRKVARMALAHLWHASIPWDDDLQPVKYLQPAELASLRRQLETKTNTPFTTSMGRLFDAASALIGIRQHATYEGQAAIEMEAIADPDEQRSYSFDLIMDSISPARLWHQMLVDIRSGVSTPRIAAQFHNAVAALCLELCQQIHSDQGITTVALSGGVWQNHLLFQKTTRLLAQSGFEVLWHHQVPANDGGISLGQALIAANGLQFNQ